MSATVAAKLVATLATVAATPHPPHQQQVEFLKR